MADNKVDIKENYIRDIAKDLLSLLLVDKSSKKNIIWAIDDYKIRGKGFGAKDQITIEKITGYNGNIIKPRIEKSKQEIQKRTKNKAEVFTPSWVCNCQNNLVDNSWFGRENVFNTENEKSWESTCSKIMFPTKDGKSWQDYVKENRLEITCGEAPYLVSRYDTVSGMIIPTSERIGLLDRKIRVVNENANNSEWLEWIKVAYKSIYGYDWQGDNVLLARENLLFTFIDYYLEKFNEMPTTEILKVITEIITWNIWQMDGLKGVIPNSCKNETTKSIQVNFFNEEKLVKELCEGCAKNNIHKHNGTYCKIKDWETGRTIKFVSLINK